MKKIEEVLNLDNGGEEMKTLKNENDDLFGMPNEKSSKNKIYGEDLQFLEKDFRYKEQKRVELKKSRFSDFFKELEAKGNCGNQPNETQDIYKNENKSTSSIMSQTQSTDYDSNLYENNSTNLEKENKKSLLKPTSDSIIPKKEPCHILDINKVISLEDLRTTLMIKNIPNKFNKDLLLSIIDQNFKGTYDLFILPTDDNKCKNFGYAFINFTSSYYIPYFYFLFNGKMWSSTNSKKICELTYSKVQGKTNLLAHYPSKIVYGIEDAYSSNPQQKFIIPNIYKLTFNKFFPNEKIEEHKFYFITKMPSKI